MLYGGYVVTSNYNGGDISVFPIKEDGSVAPESQYFDMHREGSGMVSHIHCCQMTPDHQYMLANDLGNDCIWRFQVNDGKEFLSNPVARIPCHGFLCVQDEQASGQEP
jgi:6-phosphogluconolactonase